MVVCIVNVNVNVREALHSLAEYFSWKTSVVSHAVIYRRGHVLSMRQGPYIQSSSPATASRYSICGHRPRETITLAWACVGISLHVRPTVCTFTEMQNALSCRSAAV